MDPLSELISSMVNGLQSVSDYLAQHTVTCLIPAFFIAGAIAALIKKDAILKYFGAGTRKAVSYPVASLSGTVLAVCSCTILPLFAGIYKKGSGLGPATTFLFSGPAINVLAIVYTAQVLGYDIGLARALAAIVMSIVLGLVMAFLYRREERTRCIEGPMLKVEGEKERPRWVTLTFFAIMIMILVVAASQLDALVRVIIVYALTVALTILLIYYFTRDDVTEWGLETWDLTKKILPILLIGTFIVGIIAYFLPPETFRPYLGDNSITANLLASFIGVILYMPTLLEVPIIGTTFGYSAGVMAGGPALSLLLAGPSISLPSIIVLARVMGWKRTMTYVLLVISLSTICGVIIGPWL